MYPLYILGEFKTLSICADEILVEARSDEACCMSSTFFAHDQNSDEGPEKKRDLHNFSRDIVKNNLKDLHLCLDQTRRKPIHTRSPCNDIMLKTE